MSLFVHPSSPVTLPIQWRLAQLPTIALCLLLGGGAYQRAQAQSLPLPILPTASSVTIEDPTLDEFTPLENPADTSTEIEPGDPAGTPSTEAEQGLPFGPAIPLGQEPLRTQPGGLNPIVSDAYRLTNGDMISLWVANVPEYSTQYQVLGDGSVNLPVIGHVQVWGLTLDEAAVVIETAYDTAEILVEPVVTVVLASMNPLRIAIVGEINHPGSYILEPMNGEAPSLTTAIRNAGGITEKTDLKEIQIYRLTPDHRQVPLQVSLWDLLIEGDLSQDIALKDGDTIVLARADNIDFPTAHQSAIASFSAEVIQVNVVGEVRQPGLVTVPADTSLNEILLMAGGFSDTANSNSVGLFRLNPNGSIASQEIAIDPAAAINAESNPLLNHRDVIVIGESTGSRIRDISTTVTDILGSILNPISGILSVFDLFSSF